MLAALGAYAAALWRARAAGVLDRAEVRSCLAVLGFVVVWAGISSALAISGAYLDPRALLFLPLLVGFAVPVLFVAACALGSATLRNALRTWIFWMPLRWLIAAQAIRITAVGTVVKYLNGELPGHFILPVGVPDFLVGLTALPLAFWASDGRGRRTLIVWNVLGSAIFVYAGFAMHFSVASPIQIFSSGPTTESLFRFPLALVPTVLVPLFVATHAATLWRLQAGPRSG